MDQPWWQYMAQVGYFKSTQVVNLTSVSDVLSTFSSYYKGVVLYDPKVPSTGNVASTASGARDLVPICYRPSNGSLYSQFVAGGPKIPVHLNLVGLFNGNVTGSAKCDAYMWAIKEFLSSGESSPGLMGYYIDYWWTGHAQGSPYITNTVSNHDYFIANKAFFWDLDVWADQTPNDDPAQPLGTDRKTMVAIMEAANAVLKGQGMIHVGGFTPWNFKYVNQVHQGVPTEWETAQLLTSYNAFMDADACCVNGMANSAFFSHFPLPERLVQNPKQTRAQMQASGLLDAKGNLVPRGYVMLYVGDYDSAAWLYSSFKGNWDAPSGSAGVPLGWALNPNLMERFPLAFAYAYANRSKDDYFITGDSGAGYVNPTALLPPRMSGLPSAAQLWRDHNTPYYARFNIAFTGFLINGFCGPVAPAESMYPSFSWDGMVDQGGTSSATHMSGNTPVFLQDDLPQDPAQAAQAILQQAQTAPVTFHMWRSVLKPRSYYRQLSDALEKTAGDKVRIVDPYTLGYLARSFFGGNNNDRATYMDDTIPRLATSAWKGDVQVTVRNEGWNTWAENG
eukprot:TRINITY_DN13732_c0_g1_i4.p1 TRINITY_DN13732_c0_g1~~TRINITY_DN13732_c0_g1_i4.p1  ORF type:complete len:563 (-),score=135.34 TRINITY_DN13732_c0_g1_i4:304-1992(-)